MLNFFEPIEPIEPIKPITPIASSEPTEPIHTDTETGVNFDSMTFWKTDVLFPWTLDAMKELSIEMRMGDLMTRSENFIGTPKCLQGLLRLPGLVV